MSCMTNFTDDVASIDDEQSQPACKFQRTERLNTNQSPELPVITAFSNGVDNLSGHRNGAAVYTMQSQDTLECALRFLIAVKGLT